MNCFSDAQRQISPKAYNLIIVCLLGYILVDFVLFHWGPVPECENFALDVAKAHPDLPDGASQQVVNSITGSEEDPLCKTALGHLKFAPEVPIDKAWNQMKWIGAPAYCKVKGHLIESLDPLNNFRRGFALKFVSDVEDKTLVLPWLYGTKVNLNTKQRRVYLDFGANDFRTSVTWFLQMYPCDFTEVHAWEVNPGLFNIPSPGFNEDTNWIPENPHATRVIQTPKVSDWMVQRIKQYSTFVSDDDGKGSVNITRFMKEELKLAEEDTVVVKMDIEGAEWPILQRWLNDPEMAQIIDELFVEIHYKHPSMLDYHWGQFTHTREEATQLMAELRAKGFFVHAWP